MLVDMNSQTAIMYMPDQNMAVETPLDPNMVPDHAPNQSQNILNHNPKVIGTEILEGKSCLVVEYTDSGTTVKAWVWEDTGIAIRREITGAEGKTIMELKNVVLGDIPDSMFTLPEDVNLMSL